MSKGILKLPKFGMEIFHDSFNHILYNHVNKWCRYPALNIQSRKFYNSYTFAIIVWNEWCLEHIHTNQIFLNRIIWMLTSTLNTQKTFTIFSLRNNVESYKIFSLWKACKFLNLMYDRRRTILMPLNNFEWFYCLIYHVIFNIGDKGFHCV